MEGEVWDAIQMKRMDDRTRVGEREGIRREGGGGGSGMGLKSKKDPEAK